MNILNGNMFRAMLGSGYAALKRNIKEVNRLNVFPIPDGDTGTNIGSTMEGGLKEIGALQSQNLGELAQAFANGALYSAKGNSGVILSQFFAGLSEGLADLEDADVSHFAHAMQLGVKRAYQVVQKPVEGTILTVMREGSSFAMEQIKTSNTFEDYFTALIQQMKISLENTPELLQVLKDAGVIDSGGAGLLYIVEGMAQAIGGKIIEDVTFDFHSSQERHKAYDPAAFNADSKLDFGYCTEFILQLLNDREGPAKFKLDELIAYYETLGDSLIAFQNGTLVKVHVHTKTPDLVISYAQKYGEFVTFKMDNMTVQHHETLIEKSREVAAQVMPQKDVAIGAVVALPSQKAIDSFKGYHEATFLLGGDSINPSAEEFLLAYRQSRAKNILVLANNKNAVLAAKQAATLYSESTIHVIENTSLGEGYAAFSIFDAADLSLEDNLARMQDAIMNATTVAFSKASKDALVDGIAIKENEEFAIEKGKVVNSKENLVASVKAFLEAQEELDEKSLATLFYGEGVSEEEKEEIQGLLEEAIPFLDVVSFDIERKLYDLELILE